MKREFHNIQLINRKTDWKKDATKKKYTALTDKSSIFVYYSVAEYKMFVFKKGNFFQIDNDYIIFDDSSAEEKSI